MSDNYSIGSASLDSILDGKTHYLVPDYQRSYDWKKEQVEELWEDLMLDYMNNPCNKNDEYLLGPIVISYTSGRPHYIVDGQQRLVTLTLLFCAIRKSLLEYENTKTSDHDKETVKALISEIDKSILDENNGLIKLNDIANDIFQDIQRDEITIQDLQRVHRESRHSPTKKLITNYRFLIDEVKVLSKNCNLEDNGTQLIQAVQTLREIINDIKKKNFFVHVIIHNDEYSHQVFESLNSTGQPLNQADLVKSHLLKTSAPDESGIDTKWQKIMDRVDIKKEPDHMLYESLLSRTEDSKDVSKKNLYKKIKEECNDKDSVENYLRELDVDSTIIELLNNPDRVSDRHPKTKHLFYGIKQIRAVYIRRTVIAACRKWDYESEQAVQLTDCLLKFFFMYRTIGEKNIDKIKTISRKTTQQIISGKPFDTILWTILKNDNKPDVEDIVKHDEFCENFKNNIYSISDDIAKYILISLEHQLRQPGGDNIAIPGSSFELEHIFPKKPKKPSPLLSNHTDRLGNLTLLPSDWNKILTNDEFKEKKDGKSETTDGEWEKFRKRKPELPENKNDVCYSKSGLELNRLHLKNYDEWTVSNIEDREKKLCDIAYKIWDLSRHSNNAKKPTDHNTNA